MAKKITRGNRVQRFAGWTPEHKAAVLDKLGITLDDFRSYGGHKKQRVLNRAFDGQKPSGGGTKPSAFDRNDPAAFTAPLSYNQTLQQGNAAADLVYKPQQQILQQQATNIPSWFDQYRQSLSAAQTQQQQMAQPMLDQTAARADNAGKPTAGIDPNSQAGQDDILAAAGRKALIDAGLAALQGVTATNQGYLAGRVGVANTAQQQALTDNTTAQKSLAAERGSYLTKYLGDSRENERKFQLESAAFDLDSYKAQQDAASAGQKTNKWGYTADEWSSFGAAKRERIIKRQSGYGKDGSKGPSAKDLAMYDINGDGKLSPGEYANRPDKPGKGKDEFGNTDDDIRTNNNYWRSGRNFLSGPGKSVMGNRATAIAALQGESHLPYDIAVLVYEREKQGYLTPKQAKKLQRLGIKLKAGVVHKPKPQNLPGTTGNTSGNADGQNRPG